MDSLVPRHCGRSVQSRRALYCDSESAKQIVASFAAKVREGEIATEISASLKVGDETKLFRFLPVALG